VEALTPLGIRTPDGFATTADAYRELLRAAGLERVMGEVLGRLDVADIDAAVRTLDAESLLGNEDRQHYHTLGGLTRRFQTQDEFHGAAGIAELSNPTTMC
jgi:pyruvate,water dikinase